jgi:two-component system sensor histidine kinase CreC
MPGTGRIIGVLTVSKPNQAMAPFIARSQGVILRWGMVLLGTALLVGVLAAWWMSRQLAGLRRYADAVTAGERAALPDAAGEFAELGRALETMRDRLEGKQYVEHYVHALTHELKSPLAAIRGAAELLETPPGGRGLPDADRERFVARIGEQSERMAEMVDKLLALAAVEYRQRIEQPAAVDTMAMAREVVEDAATRLQVADVRCELVDVDGLPAMRGDAFLLRQMLGNLLDNAIDFSPRGGVVEIRQHVHEGTLKIEVRDRGAGIPDYARSRVFERFYSLPRPEGGSRSSGLGLTFVAEVAKLHGGRVTIADRDGGGTVATVILPLPA